MKQHFRALDGVRGLAIAMVLMLHFFGNFQSTNFFEQILTMIAARGTLGVELFFVLSGFLITGILLRSKESDPHFFRNFYMRRTLRIFPLYYGTLFIIFCILPWIPFFAGPVLREMQDQQVWAWTYTINILVAKEGVWTPQYISHFWSLAVEEHFYLVWPVTVYFLSQKNLIRVSLAGIILSTLLCSLLLFQGVNQLAVYTLTPCRMAGLCLGALIAAMPWRDFPTRYLPLLLGLLLAAKMLLFGLDRWDLASTAVIEPLKALTWILLFGVLILAAMTLKEESWTHRLLTTRTLTFLGQYSYGLYVVHNMISWGSDHHQGMETIIGLVGNHTMGVLFHGALGMGASILVAYASYHAFEKHFLKLKQRFESPGTVKGA
jgi:peptidoglycan/LPS O-acetylase OafA/YrhL